MIYAPQSTEAGRLLRSLSRDAWRALSRAERISSRESAAAFSDAMIYGTGFVKTGDFGQHRRDGRDICRRVDPASVLLGLRFDE